MTKTMTLSIDVPLQRVADLLSCAFESGDVGYWCRLGKTIKSPHWKYRERDLGSFVKDHDDSVILPLVEGCAIIVREHNDSADESEWVDHVLDLTTIRNGFRLMADPANKHAHHFGNWLAENEDMITGDVFLQFCVLDEVKYG